jgi:hypothetical protein
MQEHRCLQLQLLQHQLLVQETIHSLQVVRFHAHRVRETIHFQQVAQFRVHHNAHKELVHHDQEWLDLVQVLFVQDLQHVQVRHVQQAQDLLLVQVDQHHHHLHINQIHLVQVELLADHNVQVAVVHHNAVAQVVHLERMRARSQDVNKSHARRYAMNSTICKLHNWVERLFPTAMERLQFVCVVVHHLQISQKRLVQIQQHW